MSEKRRDLEEYKDDAAGGGIRGFLRSYVARFTKSFSLGSLPLPKNSRGLGRSIGNLGQVVDVSKAVSEGRTTSKKEKGMGWLKTAKASVPLLAKNSILGAVQFTAYDFIVDRTTRLSISRDKDEKEMKAVPIAFFGGGASGVLHGAGHLLWEQGALVFSKDRDAITRRKVVSRWGTCLLHSVSHSTLFGTYALLKFCTHPSPDESKSVLCSVVDEANERDEERARVEMAHRLLSIGVSGFAAGCAEETVNHKLGFLELVKKHRGGPAGPLPVRVVLMAGLPSLVGFLALELG